TKSEMPPAKQPHFHLIVHLCSSLIHLVISLILTFCWKQVDVHSCPSSRADAFGITLMFGALSLAYSSISAIKCAMAIRHFCFTPATRRTITLTILGTSGVSAILAGIAILVIGLLSGGVGADCFGKIPHFGTLVALGASIALNALLLSAFLLDWRRHLACQMDEQSEELPRKTVASTPVFCPTAIESSNRPDSPVPAPLYPTDMVDSMISFDFLRDIDE
ncbi:hypothetical protein PMAYCL1PPCAC_32769, partial [Pristionchus mayeri]